MILNSLGGLLDRLVFVNGFDLAKTYLLGSDFVDGSGDRLQWFRFLRRLASIGPKPSTFNAEPRRSLATRQLRRLTRTKSPRSGGDAG
jgi:hypothetical protein